MIRPAGLTGYPNGPARRNDRLCEAAKTDAELRSWCEAVQFAEMSLLLAATYVDAIG